MRKIKILTVFGTRPEVIKLAPFIRELENDPQFSSVVCASTQQRELQNEAMALFNIKANYDLDIMLNGQDLYHISEAILHRMKEMISVEQPDYIVVQGDTTTAFVAALSGFYSKIPVVHIEAGLRTGDMLNPYPEEANRSLISKITSLHMAPTAAAVANLRQENIVNNVYNVGNTIVDAIGLVLNKPIDQVRNKQIMITVHRRENFGDALRNICQAIVTLAQNYSEFNFIWPVHPNPNIRDFVYANVSGVSNIHLCAPMSYAESINAINDSQLILSDSGGIQEEACILGKNIVVLREQTERPEIIQSGHGVLAGSDTTRIIKSFNSFITQDSALRANSHVYGAPGVVKRIANIIKEHSKL